MSVKVNIAGSGCAAGVSSIRAAIGRAATKVIASRRRRREGHCADSESQVLAIKKFSCLTALRLTLARQSRFFCESRTADSQQANPLEAIDLCLRERFAMLARAEAAMPPPPC
jgi:hypothetical protein